MCILEIVTWKCLNPWLKDLCNPEVLEKGISYIGTNISLMGFFENFHVHAEKEGSISWRMRFHTPVEVFQSLSSDLRGHKNS